MFISYMVVNEQTGEEQMEKEWQQMVVLMVGYIQTVVAGVVVVSYYIEYRANFIF